MDRLEKNRESVRRWYARHRDEYSVLRKERYASDPERRKKAQQTAIKYRAERRRGLKIQRTHLRYLNDKPVTVYTSGRVADKLKCSQQFLRNLEADELIPASIFPDKHRFYTAQQILLIKGLIVIFRKMKKNNGSFDKSELNFIIEKVHKLWGEADDASTEAGRSN